MKKLLTMVMVLIMSSIMLSGCGSDPVADELENFYNVQMSDVNANFEKLTASFDKIGNSKSLDEMSEIAEKELMVTINDSMDKLSKIELTTNEVKDIKAKYVKVMEKYKEGVTDFQAAIKANDEKGVDAALKKMDEGAVLLEDYQKAVEALAKEKNMEMEE